MPDNFKLCPHCAEYRGEALNAQFAMRCPYCKGTGFVRLVASYICNKCGGSLCDDGYYPYGLVETKVGGGYNSEHLTDLLTYTFSICEKCLRDLFSTFKIPPTVTGESTYEEDLEHYRHRIWKQTGGRAARLATGYCNHIESCTSLANWAVMDEFSTTIVCDDHRKFYDDWNRPLTRIEK